MTEHYRRFIVFAHTEYYPGGGLDDVEGSFSTLEEAREEVKKQEERGYDSYILDCAERREVQ